MKKLVEYAKMGGLEPEKFDSTQHDPTIENAWQIPVSKHRLNCKQPNVVPSRQDVSAVSGPTPFEIDIADQMSPVRNQGDAAVGTGKLDQLIQIMRPDEKSSLSEMTHNVTSALLKPSFLETSKEGTVSVPVMTKYNWGTASALKPPPFNLCARSGVMHAPGRPLTDLLGVPCERPRGKPLTLETSTITPMNFTTGYGSGSRR